jgi:hypothetical protein
VILARLTPSGLALFQQTRPQFLALVKQITSDLTTEEQEGLAGYCERMHRAVEALGAASELSDVPLSAERSVDPIDRTTQP